MVPSDRNWRVNIPELLGLFGAGLDDMGADGVGNVLVSDGVNGKVYRLGPGGVEADVFSVIRSGAGPAGNSLNLAVADDSTFCVADSSTDRIVRYDEQGRYLGEFPAQGVVSICSGPDGVVYALTDYDGETLLRSYDQMGFATDLAPAPPFEEIRLDPSLVNMESDSEGAIYVTYGMPPYGIWKLCPDGSCASVHGRPIDYPEQAILIADIAIDRRTGGLWALLACRESSGLQLLDAFGPDGSYIRTVRIPPSDNLYGLMCASETGLYLLDTDAGPGGGSLLHMAVDAVGDV